MALRLKEDFVFGDFERYIGVKPKIEMIITVGHHKK